MIFFLTSQCTLSNYENNVKTNTFFDKSNNFVENLKEKCKKTINFVYLANNPTLHEDNDLSGKLVCKAFKDEGFGIKSFSIIDDRNLQNSESLIKNADVLFLRGGILEDAITFFKQNKLDEYIKNSNAVVIGQSAGSMILSENVYQYPETKEELTLKRFIKGFGFFDLMLIPHFNPVYGNELTDSSFDMINDFYLPDSKGKKFIALENGSYIIIENDMANIYGNAYIIKDAHITQISHYEKNCNLEI